MVSISASPHSIHDLEPLEAGGPIARQGFAFQDHVAAHFCLEMVRNPNLSEVWCETLDDIVLIWGSSPNQTVEFVQVKANDPDQYWSMSKVTQLDGRVRANRANSNGAQEGKGSAPHAIPSCILEKSLAHDRCKEPVCFRIVTWVPTQHALRLLTFPLDHVDRNDGVPVFEALCVAVPPRVRPFTSRNGNDYRFWLKHMFWQVVPAMDDLHRVNELLLQTILEQDGHYLLQGQRHEVYLRILAMVKEAGDRPFQPDPSRKKLVRLQFLPWLRERADQAQHPKSPGTSTLLREKMQRANLPDDMINAAIDSRMRYLGAIRRPGFLDLSDREHLEGAVASRLLMMRSELYSGVRPNDGPTFHNACLKALEQIELTCGTVPAVPKHLLQGCMYEMASRCAHRFDGAN